jgi:hypothetical protein
VAASRQLDDLVVSQRIVGERISIGTAPSGEFVAGPYLMSNRFQVRLGTAKPSYYHSSISWSLTM